MHVFERLRPADAVARGAVLLATSPGIDGHGQTLTFHLRAPSGTFLSRLTLPFTCAVPLDTPLDPNGPTPLASAGPYRIASYTPDAQLVLERNPNYHAGRPARFDRIVYTIGIAPDADAAAGRVRPVGLGRRRDVPRRLPEAVGPVRARQPGRGARLPAALRQSAAGDTEYLGLNTSRPLFSDPRVRKAVNLALDRPALIAAPAARSPARRPTRSCRPASRLPGRRPVPAGRAERGRRPGADGRPHGDGGALHLHPPDGTARAADHPAGPGGHRHHRRGAAVRAGDQIQREGTLGEPFDITTEGWIVDYPDAEDILYLLDGRRSGRRTTSTSRTSTTPASTALRRGRPQERQRPRAALGALDVDTMRDDAPWAPIDEPNQRDLFSHRIGCQVYVPCTRSTSARCATGRGRSTARRPRPSRRRPKVKLARTAWRPAASGAGWTRRRSPSPGRANGKVDRQRHRPDLRGQDARPGHTAGLRGDGDQHHRLHDGDQPRR